MYDQEQLPDFYSVQINGQCHHHLHVTTHLSRYMPKEPPTDPWWIYWLHASWPHSSWPQLISHCECEHSVLLSPEAGFSCLWRQQTSCTHMAIWIYNSITEALTVHKYKWLCSPWVTLPPLQCWWIPITPITFYLLYIGLEFNCGTLWFPPLPGTSYCSNFSPLSSSSLHFLSLFPLLLST